MMTLMSGSCVTFSMIFLVLYMKQKIPEDSQGVVCSVVILRLLKGSLFKPSRVLGRAQILGGHWPERPKFQATWHY